MKTPTEHDTPEETLRHDAADATRRVWVMTAVAFLVTLVGFATMYLPAYTVQVEGASRVHADMSTEELADRTVVVSTLDIIRLDEAARGSGTVPMPGTAAPAISTFAGIPSANAGLLGAFVVLLAGVVMRLTLVQFLALPLVVRALRQMADLRGLAEDPFLSGGFTHGPGIGVTLFSLTAFALITLCLLTTVQTLVVNQRERAAKRAKARACGERPEGTAIDLVGTVLAGYLSRYMRAPEPTESDDEHATA